MNSLTERDLMYIRAKLNAIKAAQPSKNNQWKVANRVLKRLGL
jgi:hypothetical protein